MDKSLYVILLGLNVLLMQTCMQEHCGMTFITPETHYVSSITNRVCDTTQIIDCLA